MGASAMGPTPAIGRPDWRTVVTFVVLLMMAFGALAVAAPPAEATHFRAAQLNWTATGSNTAEFESTISVRRSFFGAPNVGDTISVIGVDFGDGSSAFPAYTVVSVDAVNDVLIAETTFSHTYAGPGPYSVVQSSCCRLSGPDHINNPDGSIDITTVVDMAATSANPVSAIAPIIDCPVSALCQFVVPGFDPDGQGLSYRLATSSEAGAGFSQPLGASIDPATGLYSWDTTGAAVNASGDTFYSTQVIIENLVGANVVTYTAVDFFIRLGTSSANQQPVFVSPTPADGTVVNTTVGSSVTFDVTAQDPDTADTVTLSTLGLPTGASFSGSPGNPATGTFSWTPTAAGTSIITLQAQDQLGLGATPRSVTIVVAPSANQPPVADAGGTYIGSEGSPISFDASASFDPDGDPVTYDWDFGDGTTAGDAGATPSHTYADNDLHTVCVTVDDGDDDSTNCTTADVANVPPTVESLSVTPDLVAVGQVVDADASFIDPGSADTHVASVDWGDGTASNGLVSESNGDGTVIADHIYSEPGVYTVSMTVTDDDGGEDTALYEFVVVYDPDAGFVTGGGWIDSPEGAYTPDPSLTGKASFGFVSKYKKGASVPTGNTEFQFRAGDLNFHSSEYDWLVVTGSDTAMFKGSGTINGGGDYSFMIWAGDGDPDTFRIKVWTEDGGAEDVIYDNGTDQTVSGGNIVVHTKQK